MKKPFAPLLLAAVLCLSACSAQPTEPQHTSAPETPEVTVATAPTPTLMPSPSKLPELATEQKPAPTSAPQQGSEPEKYIEATVSVFYCYNRWLDPDGNWINSGHVFYSVCGNCGGIFYPQQKFIRPAEYHCISQENGISFYGFPQQQRSRNLRPDYTW